MQDSSYFKALSNPSLEFAIKDIRAALDLIGKFDLKAHDKYMDQLGFALTEKRRRTGKDCCPCCARPL